MFSGKAQEKLLQALRWDTWKKGLDLVREGAGKRGTIYVHLALLEEAGLIVFREGQEQVALGLRPRREYKLTESGLRQRSEMVSGEIYGVLVSVKGGG